MRGGQAVLLRLAGGWLARVPTDGWATPSTVRFRAGCGGSSDQPEMPSFSGEASLAARKGIFKLLCMLEKKEKTCVLYN